MVLLRVRGNASVYSTKPHLRVEVLLSLASLLLGLAGELLLFVASDGTDNVVNLAGDLVLGTLDVALSFGGLDLGLALGVLLLAGGLPVFGTENVSDGLLHGTSDRVVVSDERSGWSELEQRRRSSEEETIYLPVSFAGVGHID